VAGQQFLASLVSHAVFKVTALFRDHVQHIADRRFERISLPAIYGSRNPFPWMSETIDPRKEKNFFETRVTEYQPGANLAW
jgi:ribonucleoside-diphosphate reductase beta chain